MSSLLAACRLMLLAACRLMLLGAARLMLLAASVYYILAKKVNLIVFNPFFWWFYPDFPHVLWQIDALSYEIHCWKQHCKSVIALDYPSLYNNKLQMTCTYWECWERYMFPFSLPNRSIFVLFNLLLVLSRISCMSPDRLML